MDSAEGTSCQYRDSRRRRKAVLRLKASRAITKDGGGDCAAGRRRKFSNYTEIMSTSNSNENVGRSEISGSLECGYVLLMGRRRAMEDTVTVVPEIVSGRFSFFGVYDGHGGDRVANACRDRLHKLVEEELEMMYNNNNNGDGGDSGGGDWTRIMKSSFSKMDDEVMMKDKDGNVNPKEKCGSTATVVIVGDEEIVVANCGDSRAVLCSGGVAVPLSTDHKPSRPDEAERITGAGGQILDWNGCRVEGILAISRSIGDHYLRPYVISEPTVTINKRNVLDEFIILATDGLWDVMSNEVACDMVRKCFDNRNRNRTRSATDVASFLAKMAIAKGSGDNVSVIVVKLETKS